MNWGISCVCHIFRINPVSFPYHFRIVSVSFPYHPPIILLLRSGEQYGNNTESNEWWTNENRWNKGGSSYYHCKFLWQWQDSNKLFGCQNVSIDDDKIR